jgi:hypothetical protein
MMTYSKKWWLVAGLSTGLWASSAQAITLTMDLPEPQAVDGLVLEGVHFNYAVGGAASTDANLPVYAVGDLLHIQDPVLEGSTDGSLVLNFDTTVTDVSFGVALQAEVVQPDAVWVQSWLGSTLQDQRWLTLVPEVLFAEARYALPGLTMNRVQISFAVPNSRFVFDNLSFTPAASPVPEPASHLLWFAGMVVLGGLAQRSQRHG